MPPTQRGSAATPARPSLLEVRLPGPISASHVVWGDSSASIKATLLAARPRPSGVAYDGRPEQASLLVMSERLARKRRPRVRLARVKITITEVALSLDAGVLVHKPGSP